MTERECNAELSLRVQELEQQLEATKLELLHERWHSNETSERFERPLVCDLGKDGSLTLQWIHGPQGSPLQKRLSIYVDSDEENDAPGPLKVYVILTGPGCRSEIVWPKTPAELATVVRDYMAVPF